MAVPCHLCLETTESTVACVGLIEDVVPCCLRCQASLSDELATLREQFEALLAAGVSRERANEIMSDRIFRGAATA